MVSRPFKILRVLPGHWKSGGALAGSNGVVFLVPQAPVLGIESKGAQNAFKMPSEVFDESWRMLQSRTIQKNQNHNHVSSFLWFSISEPPPKKKVGHRQPPASCSTQSYLFHAPCLSPSLPQLRSKGATVLHMGVVLNKSSQEPPFRKSFANLSPPFAVP